MALNFASAHGWNGIGSSLHARSGTTLHALAFPVGPGNQTPERSTWPSDIRGGGPPGGSGTGLTLPRASTNGFSPGRRLRPAARRPPRASRRSTSSWLSPDLGAEDAFDVLPDSLDRAVGELDERRRVAIVLAIPRRAPLTSTSLPTLAFKHA